MSCSGGLRTKYELSVSLLPYPYTTTVLRPISASGQGPEVHYRRGSHHHRVDHGENHPVSDRGIAMLEKYLTATWICISNHKGTHTIQYLVKGYLVMT